MIRDVLVNSTAAKFTQHVRIGSHSFPADEPTEQGGNDAGPNPEELVLAALGSCASITVQMYADRKQWPLQAVQVHLSYSRVLVDNGSAAANASVDGIEMGISFSGDLSESRIGRLLEIAQKCPIHRLLASHVEISTNLATFP